MLRWLVVFVGLSFEVHRVEHRVEVRSKEIHRVKSIEIHRIEACAYEKFEESSLPYSDEGCFTLNGIEHVRHLTLDPAPCKRVLFSCSLGMNKLWLV